MVIIDDIESAEDCDIYIDCTNAETFMSSSYSKYAKMQKPLIIATTAFTENDIKKIKQLTSNIPVFMTGNFSVALHDFIETIKYYTRKVSLDTDIQIVEYHHNQKKDAPSGTALMIKDALLDANNAINRDNISICSIRGGNIFGEHEVIFANCKDEVVTFKHQVSSREPFADGAIANLRNVDVLILAGGHVPTQNKFMKQLRLKERLLDYNGIVVAWSAGSMNCADIVYAGPEFEGEAVDPLYERWITGLGITDINIFPHFQSLKDDYLDGLRLIEDITFADSIGHEIIALNDGSYIMIDDGQTTLYGEAYMIKNGQQKQICKNGESISL